MARKVSKELKKLIGKLPEDWDKMTIEEKIWQVANKWRLLSTDDMYDLKVSITSGHKKSVGTRLQGRDRGMARN